MVEEGEERSCYGCAGEDWQDAYMLLSIAIKVKAVISGTGVPTTRQASVSEYDGGAFEGVMRIFHPDDERCLRIWSSFVVRWCWSARAMELVVPNADGEAIATRIAQGQVHVTKMRERTPAAAATRYLPRISRSGRIQKNQRATQGPSDPSSLAPSQRGT